MRHPLWLASLTGVFLAVLAPLAGAQTLPAGFQLRPVDSGWVSPVGLCYLDQGRLLVAERNGRVWYVENEVRHNLVYDIADEVLINGDRGLLGIAVPADFDTSGWLYLLFVVDQGGGDHAQDAYSRLIRVRTEYQGGDLVALPATREHLLGDTWSTGIASCHLSHTIGALHFLSDGSLVLTTGDNAHYDATDNGSLDPNCFLPGRTPADQDVGSFRSQYDNTLCGKVLRLDPATGRGLPDNPFYTGDPDALLSRVWARGLRNPFRSTLVPGTGPREALLISDVGWNTWEEIDLALGGENFGWPCFEGNNSQPDYQAADIHGLCAGALGAHTRPLLAWHHTQNRIGFRGNCATGLCVYTGLRYPELYRGRLFFCDYGGNWMRAGLLADTLQLESSIGFGRDMNAPVELVSQPGTGDLVYCSINAGVFRIEYLGARLPPHAAASATPAFGPGDLDVLLSADGSSDPEGQALSYAWDLGDGGSYTEREFHHLFTGDAPYPVRLTVTDGDGLSDSTELLVTPHNTPPVIDDLFAPHDGDTYVDGEIVRFGARASDAEDGEPKATWTVDLHHNHHVHPDWASGTSLDMLFMASSEGSGDNYFEVRFRVNDTRGLTEERSLSLYDRGSHPQAHMVELGDNRVRVGQTVAPVGHVDYAYGLVAPKLPTLVWDWGDGTSDVFADAAHHADTRPTHVYRRPGQYKLRLVTELDDQEEDVETVTMVVAEARPSVAVFAALEVERWVPRAQQEEIVSTLTGALANKASEVRAFELGQGELLAGWMESLLSDPVADALVLLDFVPAPLIEGGIDGSLLERWVAGGNGLVWSGTTPFLTVLADDGTVALTVLGAEHFFDAPGTSIVSGVGTQTPTLLGASVLPSFVSYRAERALHIDALGPDWSVARIFAVDGDQDSDAVELAHGPRGFYTQLVCDPVTSLPRAAVLAEYLGDKLGKAKAAGTGSAPTRR